jgi:chromosomal replication initiation ATPase DnaA
MSVSYLYCVFKDTLYHHKPTAMQSEKLDKFVSAIRKEFGMTNDEIFRRTKKRANVDARQVLFYVCDKHHIPITYIQTYMRGKGLDMMHSTIIHGRRAVEERMKWDEYLKDFVESL